MAGVNLDCSDIKFLNTNGKVCGIYCKLRDCRKGGFMPDNSIREATFSNDRHTTFYLSAGPQDGPLVVFVHGWPELSLSWRHQLPFMASMGFHAVAPDMRGYGRSSVYESHEDYQLEFAVQDMLDLADHLGHEKVLWVGHDWGAPVVSSIASHHPERCYGVANLCVPYGTLERGLDFIITLVDRTIYPEDEFPAGQWEYMRFYEENFADATAPMDAGACNFVQAIFRKGTADAIGQPSGTAFVRKTGGWMGGARQAPEVPIDEDVITPEELAIYAEHLVRNGFFGPNSWYMNHERNAAYSQSAINNGQLEIPALFLAGRFDTTCEAVTSGLREPMLSLCSNLTEEVIDSGHWMAQEQPVAVNRAMARWLVHQLPNLIQH
jgi:pimeloyl-ACP methyl ester carboxylesterase